jgi:hypothetical protein
VRQQPVSALHAPHDRRFVVHLSSCRLGHALPEGKRGASGDVVAIRLKPQEPGCRVSEEADKGSGLGLT